MYASKKYASKKIICSELRRLPLSLHVETQMVEKLLPFLNEIPCLYFHLMKKFNRLIQAKKKKKKILENKGEPKLLINTLKTYQGEKRKMNVKEKYQFFP